MLRRLRARIGRTSARVKVVSALGLAAVATAVPLAVVLTGDGGLCSGSKLESFACYEQHLADVVDERDPTVALAELARLRDENGFVLSNCHTLAHAVGHAGLAKYGTINEAVKYADGTCWSGYYHGVYEQYMSDFSDEELVSVIPTICERPPDDPYAFDYYNCLHGIGHGVTIRFGNDPFQALPYCDVFGEKWERSNCYTGVFMQNIVVDRQLHQSVRLDPENPVYPCTDVEERYKGACYLTQTSYILRVHEWDYGKGFDTCDTVEEGYRDTCYVSMGRDISGNMHRNAEKVVELCSLGDPERQGSCFVGAARNAVFHDHATLNADQLCALVPERYRATCEQARDSAASSL